MKEMHKEYNRIRSIILNSDNKFNHLKSIRNLVDNFQNKYGVCNLSTALFKNYFKVYNEITR